MRSKDNNNRFKIFSVVFLVMTIGVVYFIRISNDHKECGSEKAVVTDNNGNQVITVKHICKEKYNF